jgi:hypothetical protein
MDKHPIMVRQYASGTGKHHYIRFPRVNPLTPNDPYSGRTAPLTSKRCILYNYSTNIGTEYFKHGIYSPSYPLQITFVSIILTSQQEKVKIQKKKLRLQPQHLETKKKIKNYQSKITRYFCVLRTLT